MDVMIVINQMIQLFVVIIVGFIIGKSNLFSIHFDKDLTKFVLNLTMPLMIISSVLSISNVINIEWIDIIYSILILVVLLPVVSLIFVNILPKVKEKGLIMFMLMYPNVGFMGFPVIQSILGKEALLNVAIINMAFNLSLFTIGQCVIKYGYKEKIQLNLKQLLSPGVIASVLAIIIAIFHIQVPSLAYDVASNIGNMTTPLAMITFGFTLSKYDSKKIFSGYQAYVIAIVIDVLVPLLFYPLISILIQDQMMKQITMIILALPVANAVVLFANQHNADELFAAKTVLISTLFSIVTIPLMIQLLL